MTLTEALATLRPAMAAAIGTVPFRYRRGVLSATVDAMPGRRLEWPYDGSEYSPHGRAYFLPNPLALSGLTVRPREGDQGEAGGRRYELVPLDGQTPAALVDADPARPGSTGAWRGTWLDVTDRPRRDTLVDIEIPDPDAARAASGNKARAYVTMDDGDGVWVTAKAGEGSEQEKGGRNQQVRPFRVTLAARNVPASARLKVRSGWLEEQRQADFRAGRTTAAAVYLAVESVTRDSAAALETVLSCRCVGG